MVTENLSIPFNNVLYILLNTSLSLNMDCLLAHNFLISFINLFFPIVLKFSHLPCSSCFLFVNILENLLPDNLLIFLNNLIFNLTPIFLFHSHNPQIPINTFDLFSCSLFLISKVSFPQLQFEVLSHLCLIIDLFSLLVCCTKATRTVSVGFG